MAVVNRKNTERLSIKHLISQNKRETKISNYTKLLKNTNYNIETYILHKKSGDYGIALLNKEDEIIIFLGNIGENNIIIDSKIFNQQYELIEDYEVKIKT